MNFRNPQVAIIILNWNGWEDTIECLESTYQINYPNYQLIIVDNDSEDQSLQKIREYCAGELKVESKFFEYNPTNKPLNMLEYTEKELSTPQKKFNPTDLLIIKNNKNYGFAGGNNIGIKFAIETLNSDYILLLNNDTVVDKEFLDELVTVAESDKNIGFVGSKNYYYDQNNVLQVAGGGKIDLHRAESNGIDLEEYDNGQYNHNTDLDYINGSCLLSKTELIKKIGLMDEAHFMYWEEADWCFRGSKYGYKSVYAYKSKIWHKVGKSSQTSFKIYYHNRNRVFFMRKNTTKLQMSIYIIYLLIFYFWFMAGVYLIYRRNKEEFMAFYRGTRDGFNIQPKIERNLEFT